MNGIIQEIRPLSGKKMRFRICLDNGADYLLSRKEVGRYELEEGKELTEEVYQTLFQEVFLPRAKMKAMHLLEQMDRTEAELYSKLKDSGYPEDAISAAIEYVRSYHYIDDERYARNYVRCHQENKSVRRMTMDLRNKGVPDHLIQLALEEENETDPMAQIRRLLEKKKFDLLNEDRKKARKELARAYRFLGSRGFDANDIGNAIREYAQNLEDI